jgi:GAF domain-containing protein
MMDGIDDDAVELFAEFACQLRGEPEVEQSAGAVLEFALQAVGCDHASLVLRRGGGNLDVAAATDPVAQRAILMQLCCGQGPCLAAMTNRQSVLVPDTLTEQRWPTWAAGMLELDLRSVLSVPVHADQATSGALNLVAAKPYAFEPEDEAVAHLLARHASVAMATDRQESGLSITVDTRKLIGQALGVLMEHFDLTTGQAYAVLRRYSQHHTVKLNEVARRLIGQGPSTAGGP